MSMMRRWCGCVVLLAAIGCGEKLPTTVPVSGTVTYKGNPVDGAQVVFNNSDAKGKPASGTTNSQGQFTVKTYVSPTAQANGAMPGQYEVTITKIEQSTMSSEDMMKASAGKKEIAGAKNLLPERFSNATRTEFVVQVAPGCAPFKFDLTD